MAKKFPAYEQLTALPATNLALYKKLDEDGWDHNAILYVHEIYLKTAKITHMLFRANTKPFLQHLVSVAAATALDSKDEKRVAVAIAHSAINLSKVPFGARLLGGKKAYLKRLYGDELFLNIQAYHKSSMSKMIDQEGNYAAKDIPIIHVRLADNMDDLMDDCSPVATAKKLVVGVGDDIGMERNAQLCDKIGAPNLALRYRALANTVPSPNLFKLPGKRTFDIRRS